MRNALMLGAILASGLAGKANAASTLVNVGVEKIYAPVGFDDNDEVTVVLEGYLPNSCYKLASTLVEVDQTAKTVKLQQQARVFQGTCLMALVPYTTTVRVGLLEVGTFQVSANSGLLAENLAIAASTNVGPDDYLYAPVDHVWVSETTDGRREAVIEGRFTTNCMQIQDVQVNYTGKTIQILPIMTATNSTSTCVNQESTFTKRIALDVSQPGRYLLHVRSLNGSSVNAVFPLFEQR